MLRKVTPFLLGVFSLAIALPVYAQTSAAPQPPFTEVLMKMLPMFLVVFVGFHFLIIRPQQAKEKEQSALLKGLKNGDSVVTSSGIIGRVVNITPQVITLEVSQGTKIRFEAAHVIKREEVQVKQS